MRPDPQTGTPSQPKLKIYFSDFFEVPEQTLRDFGAVDISLINDLPLFIDPFLLFDSPKAEYQALHEQIITYLRFIRDQAVADKIRPGDLHHWLLFKEVRQNWLGFSVTGNRGTGLGPSFARSLSNNLKTVFSKFGSEPVTKSSHLEKLGLLDGGVGRDHLSDFTTNLTKGYLLDYTQRFARAHLHPIQTRSFRVDKILFDYTTGRWKDGVFQLPHLPGLDGDYVLLTPRDILTRDEAWINQRDLLERFYDVRAAVPDSHLREQVDDYLTRRLGEKPTAHERQNALKATIRQFQELLDYYIAIKEEEGPQAHRQSAARVGETQQQLIENVRKLATALATQTNFYQLSNSYVEALAKVHYLKKVVEHNDGYRIFYVNGSL